MEARLWRTACLRSSWLRLRWLSIAYWAIALLFGVLAVLKCHGSLWFFAVFLLLAGIATPYAAGVLMVRNALNAPISKRSFETEFDEEELRQLSDGELRSRLPYSDLVSVREIPEGFQLYVSKVQWIFIPQSAFESVADRDKAREMLIAAGVRLN